MNNKIDLQMADGFRAAISKAIEDQIAKAPRNEAALLKIGETLTLVDDALLRRLAAANQHNEMILRPVKAVLGAIGRGKKTPFRDMGELLERVGCFAVMLAQHRASDQNRSAGPKKLLH